MAQTEKRYWIRSSAYVYSVPNPWRISIGYKIRSVLMVLTTLSHVCMYLDQSGLCKTRFGEQINLGIVKTRREPKVRRERRFVQIIPPLPINFCKGDVFWSASQRHIILTLTIPNPSKSSTCFCMIWEDSG